MKLARAASGEQPASRRILIVAMHNSVHTVRWLQMVADSETAYLVVPVYEEAPSGQLDATTLRYRDLHKRLPAGLWLLEPTDIASWRSSLSDRIRRYVPWRHSFLVRKLASPSRLGEVVDRFRPDLVHSMEVQLAGYLCLETARRHGRGFPPWLLSNWGSDIYLFRKLAAHREIIHSVASRIDFYLAECERDRAIARELGYTGPDLETVPASGGMNFLAGPLSQPRSRPASRRRIMVKGYHGWSGRALTALSSVRLAAEALNGFEIVVGHCTEHVARECERASEEAGLRISQFVHAPSHADFIAELARCRVMLGVGISDGISTTMLEALAVGTFPIQSDTACADEWIEHGRTGFVVSPYDTRQISRAIIAAVSDDELVERAAALNRETVENRWNAEINGRRVRALYEECRQGSRQL